MIFHFFTWLFGTKDEGAIVLCSPVSKQAPVLQQPGCVSCAELWFIPTSRIKKNYNIQRNKFSSFVWKENKINSDVLFQLDIMYVSSLLLFVSKEKLTVDIYIHFSWIYWTVSLGEFTESSTQCLILLSHLHLNGKYISLYI